MTFEEYERTEEQNIDLGILDMKVENYEEESKNLGTIAEESPEVIAEESSEMIVEESKEEAKI